jgi:hypothetical protein
MYRRPVVARRRGAPLLAAAAVGGVSYMAGKSVARRSAAETEQDQRLQELEQAQSQVYTQPQAVPSMAQQPTAASPAGQQDRINRLKELAELKNAEVLTEPEFEVEKQRILTST